MNIVVTDVFHSAHLRLCSVRVNNIHINAIINKFVKQFFCSFFGLHKY